MHRKLMSPTPKGTVLERLAALESQGHSSENDRDLFGALSFTGVYDASGREMGSKAQYELLLERLEHVETANAVLRARLDEVALREPPTPHETQEDPTLYRLLLERLNVLKGQPGEGVTIAGFTF